MMVQRYEKNLFLLAIWERICNFAHIMDYKRLFMAWMSAVGLWLTAATACAQLPAGGSENYLFRNIGVKDGLSQTTVLDILQDRTGFIWMCTKAGLNRYDGTTMRTYTHRDDGHSLGSDFATTICEAPDGRLWVGTEQGVYIYDPQMDSFAPFDIRTAGGERITNNVTVLECIGNQIYIAANEQGLFVYDIRMKRLRNLTFKGHPNVAGLHLDSKGRLWIGFFGGGLYFIDHFLTTDATANDLQCFTDDTGHEPFEGDIVSSVVEVRPGILMTGSDRHGLTEINAVSRHVRPIINSYGGRPIFGRSLTLHDHQVWVATEQGLFVYDIDSQQLSRYAHEPSDPFSLADNSLYCICTDREGGMWIGSYFAGVNYLPPRSAGFKRYMPYKTQLQGRHVREMVSDGEGRIWIGTEDMGLNIFDPATETFSYVEQSKDFPNIHGLCVDGDEIWVGTFSYGLKIINTKTCRIVRSYSVGDGHGLRDNTIFSIAQDQEGTFWLGTIRGLCHYDRQHDRFVYEDDVPGILINKVSICRHGDLWLATQTNGVYHRTTDGSWHHYSQANQRDMRSDKAIDLMEDATGNMWVATQGGGIYRYQAAEDRLQHIDLGEELTTVFQMVEAHDGTIWMSTSNHIASYQPKTGVSHIYESSDGIHDYQFNYSSSFFDAQGRVYFGTLNGFIRFMPSASSFTKDARAQADTPRVVATSLRIQNSHTDIYTPQSPLQQSITYTRKLTLSHRQNSFTLQLSALVFDLAQLRPMEYRLDNYDHDWQPMRADNMVGYANLPAGHYTLRVRLQNADGTWSDDAYRLDITVRPHPLLSVWAQVIYALLLAVLIFLIYRFFSLRSRYRRQHAMERFEHEMEQELYESKIQFFTNVAHEIRTPLTLIKAPLENMIEKAGAEDTQISRLNGDLHVMQQNTNRLHDLINQLLDFRKTEANGLRLNFEHCDIGAIISSIYERFMPTMQKRGLETSLSLPQEPLLADVDREGFTKIVSNLLNNAVKYGEHHVAVTLTRNTDQLVLLVANDGPQIPPQMRRQIFTPFFRIESKERSSTVGTGIGLAMTRSLTELHNGTIQIDDHPTLNIFHLQIPIAQKDVLTITNMAYAPHKPHESHEPHKSHEPSEPSHPHTILLVEDNEQLLAYEQQQLEQDYDVICATNGEEALQLLRGHDIHLIVSDIMMEPMSGLELCKAVKQDVEMSHIPVILLTALTTQQAKMQGMENGADAYIEKPFSLGFLRQTISRLLAERESVKKAFAESPFTASESVSISQADNEFLQRLKKVVDKHMNNSDLNVDLLASEMHMSRSSLNRKIRGTLDISPNEYIKIERLKKAASLLKSGKSKIANICYEVGFTTPSYFTKCFYKQFGLLPKEFMGSEEGE